MVDLWASWSDPLALPTCSWLWLKLQEWTWSLPSLVPRAPLTIPVIVHQESNLLYLFDHIWIPPNLASSFIPAIPLHFCLFFSFHSSSPTETLSQRSPPKVKYGDTSRKAFCLALSPWNLPHFMQNTLLPMLPNLASALPFGWGIIVWAFKIKINLFWPPALILPNCFLKPHFCCYCF